LWGIFNRWGNFPFFGARAPWAVEKALNMKNPPGALNSSSAFSLSIQALPNWSSAHPVHFQQTPDALATGHTPHQSF